MKLCFSSRRLSLLLLFGTFFRQFGSSISFPNSFFFFFFPRVTNSSSFQKIISTIRINNLFSVSFDPTKKRESKEGEVEKMREHVRLACIHLRFSDRPQTDVNTSVLFGKFAIPALFAETRRACDSSVELCIVDSRFSSNRTDISSFIETNLFNYL